MIKKVVLDYIIGFLLGDGNEYLRDQVSYGMVGPETRVLIQPSSFFDDNTYLTSKSLPALPLPQMEGVPLLFGKPIKSNENGILYISADIVASTFFLITRYEECVRREVRDIHGRFIGKESLPYRAGFLARPIVEEYGQLLRSWLRECGNQVNGPANRFSKVYLTHDVDQIWTWNNLFRALKTAGKRTFRRLPKKMESIRAWLDYKHNDPIYTFPWIVEQDMRLKNSLSDQVTTSIYFLMGCENGTYDINYLSRRKRVNDLILLLKSSGAVSGFHPSYMAGMIPSKLACEKKRVEGALGESVQWNRNHFLCSREPEDFHVLINNGITDDFTMGYADVVGFRLGTSKAVKWIDPLSGDLTDLTLHPLTVMECTLDSDAYMAIPTLSEAFGICQQSLDRIFSYAGEVVLLWHNNSVAVGAGYQRELYEKLISYCIEKTKGYSDCGNVVDLQRTGKE